MTVRIIDNTTARQYLTERGYDVDHIVDDSGENVRISAACPRCGGSGYGHWHVDGGICYDCRGRDTRNAYTTVSLKAYAQGVKRRHRAHEKKAEKRQAAREARLESQRDWCEKEGHGRITFDELDAKRAAEREAKKDISQHVGTIGERIEFEARLVAVPSWDGLYGTTYCHIFVDGAGNKLVWKTKDVHLRDRNYKIRATIKDHDRRDGENQTLITRAKLEEI